MDYLSNEPKMIPSLTEDPSIPPQLLIERTLRMGFLFLGVLFSSVRVSEEDLGPFPHKFITLMFF